MALSFSIKQVNKINVLKKVISCLLILTSFFQLSAQKLSAYTLDENSLSEGRKRVLANDPRVMPALEKLKESAEKYLQQPDVNVTQKGEGWDVYFPKERPVDIHDYVSFAIYFYPDTARGNSILSPWVNLEKLGGNHVMREKFDYPRNSKMVSRISTFAKAWYFTNDKRYAQAAVSQLRAWFINPATRMNPNMQYGQFVPFHPEYQFGAYWGIIEAMSYNEILDAVALVKNSGYWSEDDDTKMKEWLYQWSQWLRKSANGQKEGRYEGNNNHGIYYDIQLTTAWMFLGNYKGINWEDSAKNYFKTYVPVARIKYQIDENGGMYKELPRPNAAVYECMCLKGFELLAISASKYNIDLWNWNREASDKRSIREAIEWLFPYYNGQKKWTYGNYTKNPLTTENALEVLWVSSKYLGGDHSLTFNNLIVPTIKSERLAKHEYNLLFPR